MSEEIKPNSITVITCDAIIQTVKRYEHGDIIEDIKCNGRGGTCVMPVFDYIRLNNLNVDSMIYFTDLGIWDYPKQVEFPLLWVSTDVNQDEAPVGNTTYLKVA